MIMIMVDDLGWRDLACYGSTFYETPNIDRYAQSAMRFTEGYSAHPACSPTRCSVLTGQLPARSGFTSAAGHIKEKKEQEERSTGPAFYRGLGPSSVTYLDTSYYTLGEAMLDAGYATSFFGKWHLGHKPYIPEVHGFETVRGGRWHSGPPGNDPDRKFFPPWNDCETLDSNLPADTHVDDYLTDLAIDYIEDREGEPFFMCYWPYSVHAPFQSKPELIKKWQKKIDPNDPQRSPTMAAMIEVLDENIGRLMASLEKNGIADNTIVLFLSDNGGNMYNVVDGTTPTNNAPLRGGKVNSFEGGVRIPFMVRWPGVTQAGSVNDAIVSTTDLYATLLEMTGQPLRPEDHKDSVSFVPALKGEAYDREPLICDMAQFADFVGNVPNTFVRDGKWKLTRYWFDSPDRTHRHELFNLDSDIGETNDVADAHPEVTERLKPVLDQYFAQEGIKQYHPNASYDGLRVSKQWAALSSDGNAAMHNGVMTVESDQPGFGIFTPMVSRVKDAIFHFEARSTTRDAIKLQWTSTGQRKRTDAASKSSVPDKRWQEFSLPVNFRGNGTGLYLTLPEGGRVELRHMRIATPEGTVMMTYDEE
ncbi:N-acetylgalactosamine 6-sulfate sulfatase (GALNS) [Rhodopirellula sp. SWK7]|nr:N-acetylgalactosamine 6-sulfate sulfatase (GALNS) [Rhodopirellula sp. SWK7]